MSTLRNLLILTASAALLAACSGPDIAMLKSMPNKGTAFDKGLQAGYTQLAADEAKEHDYADADHFGKKATMAANGQNVLPDRLYERKVPKKYQAELQAGWQRLTLARTHGGKTKAPAELATAQTMYDCWIQEAEEDNQRVDISRCQIGFNAAMTQVDAAMKEKKMAAPVKKAPTKESHIVYFSHNSATLAPSSAIIINDAAASIKKGAKATFVIGHTDTSGSDAYNKKLADRRANAVIAALQKAGVKARISKVVAGERDSKVKTKDGVRKGVNRRVEIAILR
ncbi:MAG: OmpA family protein [Alphaproteobacteria bacterium]